MVLVWSYGLDRPWGIDGLVMGVLANLLVFNLVDRNGGSRADQGPGPGA